ncbi:methylase involved in ubiquinone/menaquinone biosynthesis [Leptolyngbya sp. PCC 7375]|nr:methylase involved in ubiquinone/menaquinone biosynthesis [Leptolyngbya sp. PCC 7375]
MNTSTIQSQETDELSSFDAIKEAHTLLGDPENIRQYYEKWAKAYNQDVSNEMYSGPEYISVYFDMLPKQDSKFLNLRDPAIKILDSGCGTGLVGVALRHRGYQHIDGFDLSQNMVREAESTQAYRTLTGNCDMTQRIVAYQDNSYDATISCGVFTLGHVPPTAIEEMIRVTKPGGLVVVSTRKSYYDSTDFQSVYKRLQTEKKVTLVSYIMDGPYIAEEGAHYWAFRVS